MISMTCTKRGCGVSDQFDAGDDWLGTIRRAGWTGTTPGIWVCPACSTAARPPVLAFNRKLGCTQIVEWPRAEVLDHRGERVHGVVACDTADGWVEFLGAYKNKRVAGRFTVVVRKEFECA